MEELQNLAKWEEYSRIKVSYSPTCSATEMTMMTLEKNAGPRAFGLNYSQLLFLFNPQKTQLGFVYILPFLPGTSFPPPTTWKASSPLSNISSHFISSMKSSLGSPGQAWVFLPQWVLQNLMHVFVKAGFSLYYIV